MMRHVPRKLLATLALLPIFSMTSCGGVTEVPVLPEPVTCPLPEWEDPPFIDSAVCDTPRGPEVCITSDAASKLGYWIGHAVRWHHMAQLCLDTTAARFQDVGAAVVETPEVCRAIPDDVDAIVAGMTLKGMTPVRVDWEVCGEINGYYHTIERRMVLCYELLKVGGGFVRFVVAHEMAHAIITQLGIPYTGLHEMAADELAAVVLKLSDREDDVLAGAEYFRSHARPENPYGAHPSDMRRYVLLNALVADSWYWERALNSWARLLARFR